MHKLGKQSTTHNCQRVDFMIIHNGVFSKFTITLSVFPAQQVAAEGVVLIILILLKAFHQQIDAALTVPLYHA